MGDQNWSERIHRCQAKWTVEWHTWILYMWPKAARRQVHSFKGNLLWSVVLNNTYHLFFTRWCCLFGTSFEAIISCPSLMTLLPLLDSLHLGVEFNWRSSKPTLQTKWRGKEEDEDDEDDKIGRQGKQAVKVVKNSCDPFSLNSLFYFTGK